MHDLRGTTIEALLQADGRELCERCHCCEIVYDKCTECNGELYDDDPMWYDPDDIEPCQWCHGKGTWRHCLGHCDDDGRHTPNPQPPTPNPRSTEDL